MTPLVLVIRGFASDILEPDTGHWYLDVIRVMEVLGTQPSVC